MKAVVAAFTQEKALVGAFSVIVQPVVEPMDRFTALARMLISLVEFQSRNILRLVAFHEVFLLPFTVMMIFAGKTNLVTPFLYYRFLSLRLVENFIPQFADKQQRRYTSRRNPYCRTICHELRMTMEALAYNPKCPGWAKNIIYKAITMASNLAPQMEAQS